MRCKYPRTSHLPWSPGATTDDLRCVNMSHFRGKEVVVTEKMDGENTSIYWDGSSHARSIDSGFHASRSWVRSFASMVGSMGLPKGFVLSGENLYAKHSIAYESLESYFVLFGIQHEGRFLSWDSTVEWSQIIGVPVAPVLWRGVFSEKEIKSLYPRPSSLGSPISEGYVVRLADSFPIEDFHTSVAKFVRQNHVQTSDSWKSDTVVPNKLRIR